jgi:hypothetical protein
MITHVFKRQGLDRSFSSLLCGLRVWGVYILNQRNFACSSPRTQVSIEMWRRECLELTGVSVYSPVDSCAKEDRLVPTSRISVFVEAQETGCDSSLARIFSEVILFNSIGLAVVFSFPPSLLVSDLIDEYTVFPPFLTGLCFPGVPFRELTIPPFDRGELALAFFPIRPTSSMTSPTRLCALSSCPIPFFSAGSIRFSPSMTLNTNPSSVILRT